MSWDVMVFRFAGTPPATREGIDAVDMIALGSGGDVRASISAMLPEVDWSDPTWGIFEGAGFSIEFNVGDDDPIKGMMLHVRGGGDAISAIMALVAPLGWSALDASTGEFLNPAAPSDAGWKGFQDYRDRVFGDLERSDEG